MDAETSRGDPVLPCRYASPNHAVKCAILVSCRCTGIKMNPLTAQLAEALPAGTQEHVHALKTDHHLVRNTRSINPVVSEHKHQPDILTGVRSVA